MTLPIATADTGGGAITAVAEPSAYSASSLDDLNLQTIGVSARYINPQPTNHAIYVQAAQIVAIPLDITFL